MTLVLLELLKCCRLKLLFSCSSQRKLDYAMLSCVICVLRLLIVYEDNYMFVLSSG